MKLISISLLSASLVANAVLAYVYIHRDGAASASGTLLGADAKSVGNSAVKSAPAVADTTGSTKIDVVATLAGKDNTEIVANLRRAGFPERVILWIIGEKVDEEIYRPRRRELRDGNAGPLPFWDPRGQASMQKFAEQMAMNKERRELLKQLVGTEFWDEQNAAAQNSSLAFLPPDKVSAVAQLSSDYNEMFSAVRQDMMLAPLPEDREKLKLLYTERQADLAKILTPEEMQLYDLYASNSARSLRYALGSFQPTEAEFRAMFEARKAADEASGSLYGYFDPYNFEQRQQAEKALKEQFKAALGDSRFAEYERATDYGYQAASKIAQHFNLPPQSAVEVYEVQRAMIQKAAELQSAAARDPQGARSAITTLANEATGKLQALLGVEGFDAYKKTGGTWLRMMERGAPPPSMPSGGGMIIFGG